MIRLQDKRSCCGCGACQQVCPKHCVSLRKDPEGFVYPFFNEDVCIQCNLCEKVCPNLYHGTSRKPMSVYATRNNNLDIRESSSSGGIFTLLAEQILKKNGVVFAARFNEKWEVIHDYTEKMETLYMFRGSKYVQSYIGQSYIQTLSFLKQGRLVLFVGTPCQIKGLKLFLRKDYSNLFTVDFICHGVPSPKVWDLYLKDISKDRNLLKTINFRDKNYGWKNYSFTYMMNDGSLKRENFKKNSYMSAFLEHYSLRPSCELCPAKSGKSLSDCTIGDFWGIERLYPDFDDDKGSSVVMFYNKRLENIVLKNSKYIETSYDIVIKNNPSIEDSVHPHINRSFFFNRLNRTESFTKTWAQVISSNVFFKLYRKAYRFLIK